MLLSATWSGVDHKLPGNISYSLLFSALSTRKGDNVFAAAMSHMPSWFTQNSTQPKRIHARLLTCANCACASELVANFSVLKVLRSYSAGWSPTGSRMEEWYSFLLDLYSSADIEEVGTRCMIMHIVNLAIQVLLCLIKLSTMLKSLGSQEAWKLCIKVS